MTALPAFGAVTSTTGPWGIDAAGFKNLSTALASPQTVGKTVVVSKPMAINNKTVTGNRLVKVIAGGQINVGNTRNLNFAIDSSFDAGDHRVFGGSGGVTGLKLSKVRWFTAADGVTDDTAGINIALSSSDNIDFGNRAYLYKGTKSFVGRSHVRIRGDYRQAKILIDYIGAVLWDFPNTTPTTQRGIVIDGLTFYPASDAAAVPNHVIKAANTPEFNLTNCRFVNCSTVAQVYFDWVYVYKIAGNIFNPDEVNNNQGAAHPASVGGSGIHINSEGHNGLIEWNRIRSSDSQVTSAGIIYGGGDSTQISNNAIESNRNAGIRFVGSSQNIVISANYFEGANQPVDISYESAGTNYGHVIENNFFNSLLPIKTVASNYNQVVRSNTFDGMTLVYNGFGTSNYFGLSITGNLHRNPGSGDVFTLDTPTTLSDTSKPNITIEDVYEGTAGLEQSLKYARNSTNILQKGVWSASSGTITVADSASYYSGVRAYDLSASVTGYHKAAVPGFDTAWRGRWITIYLWLKTSDARNQTIRIAQDAGSTYVKDYTCATSTAGQLIRIQHYVHASATALEVRPYIASTNSTLTMLFPTAKLGLHRDMEFYDRR